MYSLIEKVILGIHSGDDHKFEVVALQNFLKIKYMRQSESAWRMYKPEVDSKAISKLRLTTNTSYMA